MKDRASNRWPIVWPLVVGTIASLAIRSFDLDRRISASFYDPALEAWPLVKAPPWVTFYHYGTIPPLVVGLAGLLFWVIGWRFWTDRDEESINSFRRMGLFLGLMLLIGPGLLVNSAVKAAWGRPRPHQCKEFGGEFSFRPVGDWEPQSFANSSSWSTAPPLVELFLMGPILQSFPSGHASIAFYMMAPAFLIDPKRRQQRRRWLFAGVAYGVAMGITRVMQGGHFVTDVLWAGIIVYETGAILDRMIQLHDRSLDNDVDVVPRALNKTISPIPNPSV